MAAMAVLVVEGLFKLAVSLSVLVSAVCVSRWIDPEFLG